METPLALYPLGTLDETTNVPYHLPDETEISNCTITFDLPSDDKWATIIIGAISELAREEIWEAGTGGITVAQAITTALAIRASVDFTGCVEMQIKVGSYTGNGSDPQAVTGVGFLPVFLIVWMRHDSDNNRGIAFRATPDSSALSVGQAEESIDYRNNISSLDADGFSVRNSGSVDNFYGNESGKLYSYVAFGE